MATVDPTLFTDALGPFKLSDLVRIADGNVRLVEAYLAGHLRARILEDKQKEK